MNGIPLTVDDEKIEAFGPHADGGSFIIVNNRNYIVKENLNDWSRTRTT
jgi:uncharacterized protein YlzI (FlbEa/FlbD family)